MVSLGGRPWGKDLTAPVAVAVVLLAVAAWKVSTSPATQIFKLLPGTNYPLAARVWFVLRLFVFFQEMSETAVEGPHL